VTKIMNSNEKSIATVLANYQDALNQSDTEAVMKLYALNGIFMPQHFPSSAGADAIRKAYNAVFDAIKLSVTFTLAEVHQIANDWAFARTNSAGQSKSTRPAEAEANQELFVFQKIGDEWKIARYCFSTTNPPCA
jgi:uncharacterized protein (TIGR02246 family)